VLFSCRPVVAAVVQAVRTADAAASEKVRRLKLGADGFNEFSSNDAGSSEEHHAPRFTRTGSPAAIVGRCDQAQSRRAHIIKQSVMSARHA
jgi:hypothetical protein